MKDEKLPTWGDIYWSAKKRGVPPEEAAFQADEIMRKRYRERVIGLQKYARDIKK
jgi:hypothetical protein